MTIPLTIILIMFILNKKKKKTTNNDNNHNNNKLYCWLLRVLPVHPLRHRERGRRSVKS